MRASRRHKISEKSLMRPYSRAIIWASAAKPAGGGHGPRDVGARHGAGRRPTLTFLTPVTLINVNEIGLRGRRRHLRARGRLPVQNRRHVFLRRLLLFFSTCACKSSYKGLIYTKKGGTRPPSLFSVPQRYNIFRRKANCVKIPGGDGSLHAGRTEASPADRAFSGISAPLQDF